MIEPFINDIITRCFVYQVQPLITGESDKESTTIERNVLFYRHGLNIQSSCVFYNSVLQGKGGQAMTAFGRFLTNTTIGIGGLFDPATSMGLAQKKEDFGITLNTWGVGRGPYVVLPVLGPNTVRSTTGLLVDGVVRSEMLDNGTGWSNGELNSLTMLDAIDTRHNQPFRYYESGYPFEYEMVRFLYVEKREIDAMK